MDNRHDLELAIVQIGREDTGPGSLVELTGKDRPIRPWKDPADLQGAEPVIGLSWSSGPREGGAPDGYSFTAQLDAVAPGDADAQGLEHQLLDRLRDEVLTHSKLASKGLDVSVQEIGRPDTSDLTGEGYRATARYRMRLRI